MCMCAWTWTEKCRTLSPTRPNTIAREQRRSSEYSWLDKLIEDLHQGHLPWLAATAANGPARTLVDIEQNTIWTASPTFSNVRVL
jgi:hypothetical protein